MESAAAVIVFEEFKVAMLLCAMCLCLNAPLFSLVIHVFGVRDLPKFVTFAKITARLKSDSTF